MLRITLSIIIGYLAIAATVFIGLTAAYQILGPDRAFQLGVFQVSTTWAITTVIVNLIAAVIGGVVCIRIARRSIAPIAFAALVFLLGVLVAIPVIIAEDEVPAVRPEGITMLDAMRQARQPIWIALLNPVVVAGGIMVGASWVPRRPGRVEVVADSSQH